MSIVLANYGSAIACNHMDVFYDDEERHIIVLKGMSYPDEAAGLLIYGECYDLDYVNTCYKGITIMNFNDVPDSIKELIWTDSSDPLSPDPMPMYFIRHYKERVKL